ncbi:MAG: FadR/GntR family transcriptional regulator [Phenylobacterium sp.]|uniref:FadR/GntR family transcriptional regulator n=1 Tax=Phenylobacterium sp. TaxID=1871053 RepID=UPI00273258DF|nr:FadR/GntR family transcriptional regulator [Phenylobacterium sp.]MDP3746477.1 FadR/GntR family transcriptional regulator [Phenylobacterium sp.]
MSKRRLFHDLADQIVQLIESGVFPPGARLPGERELAERFGVSRVAVREAAVALEAKGWVRIKSGSGIYVCETPDVASRGDLPKVSAFELTEARALFESEAAALAAPVISEALLAKLDELLAVMAEDAPGDDESSIEADREFHKTIASASGNPAIIHVVEVLWRMRTELPEVRAVHASVCNHDGQSRHDEHRLIVDALRRRDPQGARLAMRQHFNRLLEAMLDVAEAQAVEDLRRKSAESRERYRIAAKIG